MAEGWGPPGGGEALPRRERLRRRTDFLRCYRQGRRRHGALSVLYTAPNPHGHPRLGITVGRKVGGAVTRVRIKRRIREVYRRWSQRPELPAVDLVVHVKPAASQASYSDLKSELQAHFRHAIRRDLRTS